MPQVEFQTSSRSNQGKPPFNKPPFLSHPDDSDPKDALARCCNAMLRRFGMSPSAEAIDEAISEFWVLANKKRCDAIYTKRGRLTARAVRLVMHACGRVVRQTRLVVTKKKRRIVALGEQYVSTLKDRNVDHIGALMQAELVNRIREELATLPLSTRHALLRHHGHGVPLKVIAKEMGLSRDALSMRLHKARIQLRLRPGLADLLPGGKPRSRKVSRKEKRQ